MARKRVILELGMGNDLHGGDYTKAALRAVQDAIHHSSLSMIRSLGIDAKTQIFVEVTIGVQQPDRVDTEVVKASLPHGIVTRQRGDRQCGSRRAVGVRIGRPARQQREEDGMILIGQFDSPFVRRVAIALRFYEMEYEHRPGPPSATRRR